MANDKNDERLLLLHIEYKHETVKQIIALLVQHPITSNFLDTLKSVFSGNIRKKEIMES